MKRPMVTPHFGWHETRWEPGGPLAVQAQGSHLRMEKGQILGIADTVEAIERNIRFMAGQLEKLRMMLGRPLILNSWYRSPAHAVEKERTIKYLRAHDAEPAADAGHLGEHTWGLAVDVRCANPLASRIIRLIDRNDSVLGFTRCGIKQGGPHNGRFLHLGLGTTREHGLPTMDDGRGGVLFWSY